MKRGVTLIEVLVVIVILGVLVGLLLPAVQMARESARRVSCFNNIRQLGLALQQYETAHASYPIVIFYSPHSHLLPYIEQMAAYSQLNFESLGAAGQTTENLRISTFLCPSDNVDGGGWLSYPASDGTRASDGIFNANGVRVSGVTDGLSQTVAFSEWVVGSNDMHDPLVRSFEVPYQDDWERLAKLCHDVNRDKSQFSTGRGKGWILGELNSSMYNHALCPNDNSCSNGNLVSGGVYTASSRHRGGVSVVFADGHVKFIASGVSRDVWRALATRRGNEIISQDSY